MNLRGALVVFAKAPRAGLVKTRMCPPLSPDEAAQLYARMLEDVLVASAAHAEQFGLDPVLALHPPEASSELATTVPSVFRIVAQRGRDLGERMEWAAAEAAAGGASPVLLRGSDSPALGQDCVRRVLEELESSDVVIAPDVDGGYNLVGLRRPAAGLFAHAMSTASVTQDTVASARTLGLSATLVETTFDLDAHGDLALLAAARREGDTSMCPSTITYLDENDLWGDPGR